MCSGDQSPCRVLATSRCRAGDVASRQGWGRRARSQARASATAARYAQRPPWRGISRLMVDGARPTDAAIWRMERGFAMPRDLSARSASVSDQRDRRQTAGANPPFDDTTP